MWGLFVCLNFKGKQAGRQNQVCCGVARWWRTALSWWRLLRSAWFSAYGTRCKLGMWSASWRRRHARHLISQRLWVLRENDQIEFYISWCHDKSFYSSRSHTWMLRPPVNYYCTTVLLHCAAIDTTTTIWEISVPGLNRFSKFSHQKKNTKFKTKLVSNVLLASTLKLSYCRCHFFNLSQITENLINLVMSCTIVKFLNSFIPHCLLHYD